MKDKFLTALTFFKVCLIMGLTCFGGGYAMIPIMEREFVTKKKYSSSSEFGDVVTVAQSLPGLISINTVIILAYRKAGFLGVFFACIGIVIPSFVIICILVYFYQFVATNRFVIATLKGIKAAVIGILISAIYSLAKKSMKNFVSYIILASSFALTLFTPVHPLWIILASGVAMLIFEAVKEKRLTNGIAVLKNFKQEDFDKNNHNEQIDAEQSEKDQAGDKQ